MGRSAFLPSDAPFSYAEDVYDATFAGDNATSSTVIIIDARATTGGIFNQDATTFEEKIDTEIGQFFGEIEAWLTFPSGKAIFSSSASWKCSRASFNSPLC